MSSIVVAHFVGRFYNSHTIYRDAHRCANSYLLKNNHYWVIVGSLLVDLESQEVQPLIVEVHISEALDMRYELNNTPQCHLL